jgi:hypothetical protein
MPRGGHFAAMEQPDLLAEEIRAFFPSASTGPIERITEYGILSVENPRVGGSIPSLAMHRTTMMPDSTVGPACFDSSRSSPTVTRPKPPVGAPPKWAPVTCTLLSTLHVVAVRSPSSHVLMLPAKRATAPINAACQAARWQEWKALKRELL